VNILLASHITAVRVVNVPTSYVTLRAEREVWMTDNVVPHFAIPRPGGFRCFRKKTFFNSVTYVRGRTCSSHSRRSISTIDRRSFQARSFLTGPEKGV
jgi:hypothetical protein